MNLSWNAADLLVERLALHAGDLHDVSGRVPVTVVDDALECLLRLGLGVPRDDEAVGHRRDVAAVLLRALCRMFFVYCAMFSSVSSEAKLMSTLRAENSTPDGELPALMSYWAGAPGTASGMPRGSRQRKTPRRS
mgnify:CR=1 FL=1